MVDKLIIVESPAKANTLKKFLGGNVKVVASMGHLRDLPKSRLGVDVEKDFEPQYINIRGKGDLIKSLKKEAKNAKKIYLATDPDREGEAIAWHLAHILGIKDEDIYRVTFNEITKETVKKSIKNPRKINQELTDAQQARRVLDRIVGYKMSPVLWKKVKRGLSAGRVQSVAVKLVADREEEIENFIPEEYWNIFVDVEDKKDKKNFQIKFYGKDGKKLEVHSQKEVDEIVKNIKGAKYIVENVKKGERKRNPAPPFTTSTMQQEASRKLNFSLKKTMSVAQTLYEGVKVPEKGTVGLITYMRTDSTRISDEAKAIAKEVIYEKYGEEYYENRTYKVKANSQDAHEAIRPTYIDLTPESVKESLTNDQFRLYRLIYNRFMASQMASAKFDTVSIDIGANSYKFKATGQIIRFSGFMKVYVEVLENEEEEKNNILPELEQGQELKEKKITTKQIFTEPPARYTEASLVKVLEEKGIGRPSTYSPTITTILQRRYIEKVSKQIYLTDLGKIVNKLLVENFGEIVNEKFTANIEREFDEIEEGKVKWKEVIKGFYGPFANQVEKVEKELEHVELVDEVSDVPCEKCGRMMVYKYGRYGRFLACPGYPECQNAKPIIEVTGVPCPKCGGDIQIKKTRTRRTFYVCENNPDSCDYISWHRLKEGEEWNPDEGKVLKDDKDIKKKNEKTIEKKTAKKKANKTKKKTAVKKKVKSNKK